MSQKGDKINTGLNYVQHIYNSLKSNIIESFDILIDEADKYQLGIQTSALF